MTAKFKVGDVVALAPHVKPVVRIEGHENHPFATVEAVLDGIYQGGFRLDRDLGYCRWWHGDELVPYLPHET